MTVISSLPPYRRNPPPPLIDYWQGTVPWYLSDRQIESLRYNAEYSVRPGICPVCRGTKNYTYLGKRYECPDDSFGHPMLRLAKWYWLHNIPLQFQQLDWDEWPTTNKNYREAKKDCDSYVEGFDHYRMSGVGATLYSKTTGVGKTWAATAIAKALIRQGYDVWFAPFPEVKSYYEIDNPTEREFRVSRIQRSELLVLDEVVRPWTDAMRNFFADQLEELLRPRSNANLPTIITTNMTPDSLDKTYPRVFSLMSAKNFEIALTGSDARKDGEVWKRNTEIAFNKESIPLDGKHISLSKSNVPEVKGKGRRCPEDCTCGRHTRSGNWKL